MVKDKVTIEDLEKFTVGEQKVFVMPNWDKARSAASLAGQMKNRSRTYGWIFKAPISPAIEGTMQRTVTITRTA
ncbi:MAG: hypothetical protein IKK92_10660 [Prevotella sp.]|nr:hypothetical protein [Aeriscardovia sp.]MBR2882393.1 hypothetical protein [Prevotella sp.]MBR6606304.1 hypothetical protein [Prevotella sp.]